MMLYWYGLAPRRIWAHSFDSSHVHTAMFFSAARWVGWLPVVSFGYLTVFRFGTFDWLARCTHPRSSPQPLPPS
jgi:hypothetical protein